MPKLYALVASLYPKKFRDAYGAQMLQAATDMLNDQSSSIGRAAMWLRINGDLIFGLILQHAINIGEIIMNVQTKLVASLGWILLAVIASQLFQSLRLIGTTWMDTAGGLRMLGLWFFLVAFVGLPAILAVLAWLGRPATLYKKLARK